MTWTAALDSSSHGLHTRFFVAYSLLANLPVLARGNTGLRQLRKHGKIRSLQQVFTRMDSRIITLLDQARADRKHRAQYDRQGEIEKQLRRGGLHRRVGIVQDRGVGVLQLAFQSRLAAALQR